MRDKRAPTNGEQRGGGSMNRGTHFDHGARPVTTRADTPTAGWIDPGAVQDQLAPATGRDGRGLRFGVAAEQRVTHRGGAGQVARA